MPKKEKVLTVSRRKLFSEGYWEGLRTEELSHYLDLIRQCAVFNYRLEVENDPSFQQIIPYLIYRVKGQFFLVRKLEGSGEKRLHFKYMLGVGGHINPVDARNGDDVIEEGIKREWREEVACQYEIIPRLIGILKDDSNPVSRVHLGLVYLIEGKSTEIRCKEPEQMEGQLVNFSDLPNYMSNMDSWGKIVYQWLKKNQLD